MNGNTGDFSLKGIAFFLSSYSIIISVLYLTGYWGFFHINIFEYISAADFIKHALYGLVSSFIALIISSLIGELLLTGPTREVLPAGGGMHHPIAPYVRTLFKLLIAFCIITSAIVLFFTDIPNRTFIAGVLLQLPVYNYLIDSPGIIHLIPNHGERSVISTSMISLLLYANGWGVFQAQKIIESPANFSVGDSAPDYTYIGRTDGHIFVWDKKKKSTLIILESSIHSYRITQH